MIGLEVSFYALDKNEEIFHGSSATLVLGVPDVPHFSADEVEIKKWAKGMFRDFLDITPGYMLKRCRFVGVSINEILSDTEGYTEIEGDWIVLKKRKKDRA